jgi:hypothetical protein
MGLSYRQTDSGLLLAEEESAVAESLWEYDRNLKLRSAVDAAGRTFWSVRAHVGGDIPDRLVCVWVDEQGNPLPLSSGLLELVKQLDPNTRSVYLDEDTRNERRRAEVEKVARQRDADLADDMIPKHGRPVLPRSQSLRRARDKRRARGENV